MAKKKAPPNVTAMATRAQMGRVSRRGLCPISPSQYNAGWHAYMELPKINAVSAAANCTSRLAAKLIEEGFPLHDMQAYAERVAGIRKIAKQIEDYNLARAMSENAQILKGIKVRLREQLGDAFENIGFDKTTLKNLKPAQALAFAKFMDTMMRLEAFALREGADETRVKVEHAVDGGTIENTKLSRLLQKIESSIKLEPFEDPEHDIIDHRVVDAVFEEVTPKEESNDKSTSS